MLLGMVIALGASGSLTAPPARLYEAAPPLEVSLLGPERPECAFHALHRELCGSPVIPESAVLPKRLGIFDPLLAGDFEVDFDDSARGVLDGATERLQSQMAIGVDLHKQFKNLAGPVGILTFRAYLTQVDDMLEPLLLFHEVDDWDVDWRETNFNYTALGNRWANLRIGHFDLPFGLEHTIDDNGTLRDYDHVRHYGVEEDWGVTLNGGDDLFEYEAGWTRGTGNDYRQDGDPGVVSGRVGAVQRGFRAGVSFLDGKTLERGARTPTGELVARERLGVDVQVRHRSWGVLSEAAVGTDEDVEVHHQLVELNWAAPYDASLAWVQFKNEGRDDGGWDDFMAASLGLEMPIPGGWSFSAQWTQHLEAYEDDSRLGFLAMQLRMQL